MADEIDWDAEWEKFTSKRGGACSLGVKCMKCEGKCTCLKNAWIEREKYSRGLIDAQYECYICHKKHMNQSITYYADAKTHVSMCDECLEIETKKLNVK
jgi:hypothetical protein